MICFCFTIDGEYHKNSGWLTFAVNQPLVVIKNDSINQPYLSISLVVFSLILTI